MKHRPVVVVWLVSFLTIAVWGAPESTSLHQLADRIDDILQEHRLDRAFFGAKVVSLANDEVIYARNPDSYFMPASNMKLVTAVAAAEILGFDFRFQTILGTRGRIENGVLEGDLLVIGGGDPTIGARLGSPSLEEIENGDAYCVFRQWAEELKKRGITKITGRLAGDISIFAGPERGEGWTWDDFAWGYAAPVSGLQFNENLALVRIDARRGDFLTPTLRLTPPDAVRLVNLLYYAVDWESPDVEAFAPEPGVVELKGKVRSNRSSLYALSVPSPPDYFLRSLRQVLEKSGISVTGGTQVITDTMFRRSWFITPRICATS